jgi:Fic family protein
MDELIDFVNANDDRMYDLIKIALIHHRFVWIHPFGN